MAIAHQTVLGADGKPSAAIIPWEEFERIQEKLGDEEDAPVSEEWRAELQRRADEIDSGAVQLVDGADFLERLRAT